MRRPPAYVVIALSLWAQACFAANDAYESPPEIHAADILPPALLSGPHFKVDDTVRNGGYLYHFVIHSDYGDFDAQGRTMLEIRLKEVAALARIADISKSGVFLDAAKDAAVGVVLTPVKAVTTIATDPIGTVTRLPRGIGRLLSHYARAVSDAAGDITHSDSEDDAPNDLADKGMGAVKSVLSVTSAERRWAKRLGTDPYTTNKVLSKAIEDIAWFDRAGGLAPSLAGIPTIPGAGELVRVNDLAWEDPRDVRERNLARLRAMKLPEDDITAFLDKSVFTPTQQLALLDSLDALDGVAGREVLLKQALDKRTEAEIWFHLDSAALLARLRGNGVPVASILPGSKLTIAETSDNRLITVLGVDHLVWTQDIDRIAKQYVAFLANRPKAKEEIWLTGTASGRTKAELVALGYELHENVRIR